MRYLGTIFICNGFLLSISHQQFVSVFLFFFFLVITVYIYMLISSPPHLNEVSFSWTNYMYEGHVGKEPGHGNIYEPSENLLFPSCGVRQLWGDLLCKDPIVPPITTRTDCFLQILYLIPPLAPLFLISQNNIKPRENFHASQRNFLPISWQGLLLCAPSWDSTLEKHTGF